MSDPILALAIIGGLAALGVYFCYALRKSAGRPPTIDCDFITFPSSEPTPGMTYLWVGGKLYEITKDGIKEISSDHSVRPQHSELDKPAGGDAD